MSSIGNNNNNNNNNNNGDRPSLRLNLSAAVSSGGHPQQAPGAAAAAAAPPLKKARRTTYTPATNIPPSPTNPAHLQLLHQRTELSFAYNKNKNNSSSSNGHWHGEGQTTLYLIDTAPPPTSGTIRQLALHGRGILQIQSVAVHTVATPITATTDGGEEPWQSCRASCFHADPLQHVLVQPATTMAVETDDPPRCQADTQCSRGAVGMTNALRAASIASHFGEIRISYDPSSSSSLANTAKTTTAAEQTQPNAAAMAARNLWLSDLQTTQSSADDDTTHVYKAIQFKQEHRQAVKQKRLLNLSQRLANPPKGGLSLKVTLSFSYQLSSTSDNTNNDTPVEQQQQQQEHFGGLHVIGDRSMPHIYTTSGTTGDGQGPRSWLPCLDSAAVAHRASHELIVRTTGPAAAALQCLGAGETFGVQMAYGHAAVTANNDNNNNKSETHQARVTALQNLLGQAHVRFLQSLPTRKPPTGSTSSHVIPPDDKELSWSSLQVTHVWASASWAPIPVRSLGWAIGPFHVVEDPEYFERVLLQQQQLEEEEEEDDDMDVSMRRRSREERLAVFMSEVRQRGEGIRQAYFLPLYARPHVFAQKADWSLLNNPTFRLKPLTVGQTQDAQSWQDAVTRATLGVPHRALSLMRDVLALPTYRTVSYTQIWIPNAVDGGCTSGALADTPEVSLNPFLGGATADARLLPPPQARLPFAQGGGRVLQYMQARAAIRGWVRAALPLGGEDDVGFGYLHGLVEALLFSLYERGHGGYGEGGGKGGFFYSRRYAPSSGLNSSQLDFLPIRNVEDMSFVGGVAAVPIEERQTDHLWRSTVNGSESHTSALDEFQIRNLLGRDIVEVLERGVDKDDGVPMGSMGWFGSHLSLTFLSSNASSSSLLGCGAVEMMHPVSGLVYQSVKTNAFRAIVEGRAGISNFVRLVRAAFIAGHLSDLGEKELKLPQRRRKKEEEQKESAADKAAEDEQPKPPFVVCVNEILTKKGLTHTLFTRALQNLCKMREGLLAGTLVDVQRDSKHPRTQQPFVDPEGFPNSYVRAASTMYCKVGVNVEPSRDAGSTGAAKGVQCQLYAEPVVPVGGVAFGGPITVRIVENEGQFREYVKELVADGSRRDWGAQMLHTKPVTTAKAQTAASGTVENSQSAKDKKSSETKAGDLAAPSTGSVFTESNFHIGGYQAIELIRLTNLTPLLWVRVDPLGLYGGRISVVQPDACFAEQLFYDGDASAQVDAIRCLAERPLSIQPGQKVSAVYDVNVSELPVRVLGDCLRGSPALHSSLPHTPAIRAAAALALGQWQNNKAPPTKDATSAESWIGLNLLLQYFKERFCSNAVIMPTKFTRIAFKKSEAETRAAAAASGDQGAGVPKATHDDGYYYLDGEGSERAAALSEAEDLETEEDEEYRVRSACITAIASIRAKDGQTPPAAIKFLESVLEAEDASMMSNVVHPDDDMVVEKTFRKMKADAKEKEKNEAAENEESDDDDEEDDVAVPSLPYVSSMLVADTLLSLCHVNISPATFIDPETGQTRQVSGDHPVTKLMQLALDWLGWELYREKIRRDLHATSRTGISGNCYDLVAPSAIFSLAILAILRQSTTSSEPTVEDDAPEQELDKVTRASFYAEIFDSTPQKNDLTRAAAAQAFTCLCCASDRFEVEDKPALGLLTALEFMLDRIVQTTTSPSLRRTLANIMMDACTGKVASMQRIGAIAGRNDLISAASRFYNGPLGASHGGDNGSAIVMQASPTTHPSAAAVNNGARSGLRVLNRAGHPRHPTKNYVVVRIAIFATRLWRTINGEKPDATATPSIGVCAYDGALRCSLLALWQWLWPKGCPAVLFIQEKGDIPEAVGKVMTITDQEKEAARAEESSLIGLSNLVNHEIDRQAWRGEMAGKAYEMFIRNKKNNDLAAVEQGLNQPLPPIKRDVSFKQGGWSASWSQQRRTLQLDGGSTVTKIRLKVSK